MSIPSNQNTHDDAACVRLFTDTLERLNEININQMQSILDIAIAAADAANSINTANTAGSDFVEKVTALVEGLKEKADSFDNTPTPAIDHDPSDKVGAFCETVERDLNIAIENSLNNQQQLYVVGEAVLTEGAQLVLQAGKPGAE
jgi:hypothetical protein